EGTLAYGGEEGDGAGSGGAVRLDLAGCDLLSARRWCGNDRHVEGVCRTRATRMDRGKTAQNDIGTSCRLSANRPRFRTERGIQRILEWRRHARQRPACAEGAWRFSNTTRRAGKCRNSGGGIG